MIKGIIVNQTIKISGRNNHVLSIIRRFNRIYRGMTFSQVIQIESSNKVVSINKAQGEE